MDVVIIGGGVAGCITGENIDGEVLIVEEHPAIGVPLQCAGIVSVRGAKEMGYPAGVVNKVRGAYIYSKNYMVKIGDDRIRAYVYERKIMDKSIAKRAAKKCSFLLKSHADVNGKNVVINKMGERIVVKPEAIVLAEGVRGYIGKKLGLIKEREILSSVQFEIVGVDVEEDMVHVFLDKRYSKEFFTWIIPMGKDRVRVGLLDKGNSYKNLIKFINENERAKELLKNGTIIEFSSGALPIGYLKKTVKDNILLVGDCACQVKPLSGGGLYYSSLCGKIAGKVISKYLNGEIDSLDIYDKLWKKEIGDEIRRSLLVRKIFLKLSNETIDNLIYKLSKSDLIDYINKYGDMDKQAGLAIKILKSLDVGLGLKILRDLI
ncbi:geranylgeranyl reductase family protein [Methanocaldococcus sp.]